MKRITGIGLLQDFRFEMNSKLNFEAKSHIKYTQKSNMNYTNNFAKNRKHSKIHDNFENC